MGAGGAGGKGVLHRAWRPAAPGLIAAFLLLAHLSVRDTAPTWDENDHLSGGIASLRTGDFRMDLEHPPLVKLAAALAAAPLDPEVDTASEQWRHWLPGAFNRKLVFQDNDPGPLVAAGRLGVLALVGALLAWWHATLRSLVGPVAALLGLGLLLVDPNFLAHAPLINTDAAAALSLSLAVGTFALAAADPRPGRLGLLLLGAAVAVGVKFSSLVLVPILGTLSLLRVAFPAGAARGRRARDVALCLLAAGLGGYLGMWASYGLRDGLAWRRDECVASRALKVLPPSGLREAARMVHGSRAFPHAWVDGLIHTGLGRKRWGYVLGEYVWGGRWYYFPVALAVKTPPGAWLVLAVAALVGLRDRRELRGWACASLGASALLFFAVALASTFNIGIRHLLPLHALVYPLAGAALGPALARRSVLALGGVALGLGGMVLSLALAYPHYLAYFNRVSGGPEQGARWLADSNLDWGQDLPALARWARERGLPVVYLSYFGKADPAYYGLVARPFPEPVEGRVPFPDGAWVAISEQRLVEARTLDRANGVWAALQGEEPVARIGHSIRMYRIGRSASP